MNTLFHFFVSSPESSKHSFMVPFCTLSPFSSFSFIFCPVYINGKKKKRDLFEKSNVGQHILIIQVTSIS